MRGFRVSDVAVDLRYGGQRPTDQLAVRMGCNTQCDSLVCHNSGHCSVAWQNNDPSVMEASSCDCSKTSYFGGSCAEDYGLTFVGQAAFVFDMVRVLDRFELPVKRKGDSFNFAFAAALQQGDVKEARYLAVVQFQNAMKLEIILNKNGSVNAGLTLSVYGTQVFTFLGNFSDGYRHFIQTTLKDTSVTVFVDSIKFTFNPNGYQVTLASAEKIYLGGFEKTNRTNGPKNYVGCLSNADIDFHLGDRFRFTPIKYYRDTGSKYAEYTSTVPQEETLDQGQCAQFKVPGALPPPQRNVQFPFWEAPFGFLPYERPTTLPPSDKGTGFPWWIIIIVVVIIILILIFLVVLFCCICKRKSEPSTGMTPGQPSSNDDDFHKPVPVPNYYGDQHPHREEIQPLKPDHSDDPQIHQHQKPQHQQPHHQQQNPPQIYGSNQVKPNLDLPAANTHLEQNRKTKELFLNSPPPANNGLDEQAVPLRDRPLRAPIARVSEIDADLI
jgi:hypothetical protein